ncbi:hypothetical protein ACJMK2_029266 [Sinanodonta woodiana]|uniref:Uncharacterized protein n=1 Tax=Sinanodonta woodiana TaxID=1069815 RepID=A0ABD3XA31_SINWO
MDSWWQGNLSHKFMWTMSNSPDDRQLVVKFANGKTERVPADMAVWIPTQVYERLALELQMPKAAREALMEQENYPMKTLEGYMTSGPHADPEEYKEPDPICLNGDQLLLASQPWRYPYFPGPPLLFRKKENTTSRKENFSENGSDRVVPGTSMTEKQIKEKVMSQLMEHKLVLDHTEMEKGTSAKLQTDLSEQERKFLHEKLLELEDEKQEREKILNLQREIACLKEMHRLEDLEFKKEAEKQRESKEIQYDKERLLAKRDKQEENTLKKSVSFSDERDDDTERRKPRKNLELLELEKDILYERQKQLEAEKEERERLLEIDSKIAHLKGILRSERPREHTEEYREKIFTKRSQQEGDTLRRSVSFQDYADEMQEEEKMDFSEKESGLGTMETPTEQELQDRGVNTDSSLLFHQYRQPEGRPPWRKYWGKDPYRAVGAKMSAGSDPFRETALQAPLEARNQSHPYIVEWTSPVYKYVDPYAKHDYSNSVELLLKPKPPEKQSVAVETRPTLRPTQVTDEEKQAARREYRRKKINERQTKWDERIKHEDHVKDLMQDHHRERVMAQIQREQDRQSQEQMMVKQAREAKKKISKEIRERIEKNQKWEADREQMRIEAMSKRREKREALEAQREKERAALEEKRKQYKMHHSQARWNAVHNRLDEEEADQKAKNQQYQNAKVMRIEHFHKLEEEGQRKKDLQNVKKIERKNSFYKFGF